MRNVLTYPLRAAALLALTAAGVLVAAGTLALFIPGIGLGLVFLVPWTVMASRHFTNLMRRMASRWSGVPIPVPYKPAPPAPARRPDGLYEKDGSLHKRSWWPSISARLEWVLSDRATGTDLLWLLLNPVIGTALLGLPLALVVAGIWLGPEHPWAWLAIPVSIACANWSVWAYAWFCRILLGSTPAGKDQHLSARKVWLGLHVLGLLRSFVLGMLSLVAGLAGLVQLIATTLTYVLGLVFVYVPAVNLVRGVARFRRRLSLQWSGFDIPEPYRPAVPPTREPDGRYKVGKHLYRTEDWARWNEKQQRYAKDPATWRDFVWALAEPVAGAIPALVPTGLVVVGLRQLLFPAIYSLFTGDFDLLRAGAIGLAVALVAIGLTIAPSAVDLGSWWSRLMLEPTPEAAMARRIEQLTETRADAITDQAAELRRIERDLHDGAQARLVSIGLQLGALEALIETDPEAARKIASQARESSATALTELRALVRGIHPPVLAERGLGEAVRALALDAPLPVETDIDVPDRLPEPIESAMYFALVETLTNAVRHSGATSITLGLRWSDEVLRAYVADDGHGGADPARGTGLAGLRRRLGTFDGDLTIDSPAGGPTVIAMEMPCVLSSPKTTSS